MMFSEYPAVFIGLFHIIMVSIIENRKYYRAAVLEHIRYGDDFSSAKEEILEKNLKAYEIAIRTAANDGADIIVFPEYGLFPHNKSDRSWVVDFAENIPNPKKVFSNPCEQTTLFNNRPILLKLSCFAKENKMFLVANMVDSKKCRKVPCGIDDATLCSRNETKCPKDGVYLHNTNVVFNRDGALIARYYKRHLFLEFDMNPPQNPEDIYFDTDFGTFTTFVCFDLTFKESTTAVEKPGVVNVAYPTYWFDHFPLMYFATPFQQAWAIGNNINLLASNCHKPGMGTVGSGIYSATQGAVIYTHVPDGQSRLLIANVPNVPIEGRHESSELNAKQFIIDGDFAMEDNSEKTNDLDHDDCLTHALGLPNDYMSDYRCLSLDLKSCKFTKLIRPEAEVHICAYNVCCYLSYKAHSLNEDYFFVIVQPNLHIYNRWSQGTEGCFLMRCDSLGSQVCQKYVLKSNTVFQRVDIKGNFSAKHVYPYAVDSDIRLTNTENWIFTESSQVTYNNNNNNSSLLLFGLYGRYYDNDRDLI